MALFEKHRGLWHGLRAARERRRRGSLSRNRQLALEALEIRLTPSTDMWTGGGLDANWNDAMNWQPAAVPQNGDSLVFPTGAAGLTNNNDLAAETSFASVMLSGSGYDITGTGIVVTGNLDDSAPAPASNTLDLPLELDGGSITVDQTGSTLLVPGAISGSNGLAVSGNGTLDLEGPNNYSGTTTVTGAVLFVNTTQPGSPVTVNTDGTIGGTGTVGAITANAGVVSPGTSAPGMLSVSGDLNLSGTSTVAMALNGPGAGTGYSQLTVSGLVTLDNAVLNAVANPQTGNNSYVIINNTGTQPVSGQFNNMAPNSQFEISGQPFTISYAGGDGNDVVLTSLVNSTTSVTPSSTSLTYGTSITLTSDVMSADSSVTQDPTGTVAFFNQTASGTTSLGSATLIPGAGGISTATLNDVVLPAGTNANITAVYSGDGSFAASTSPAASPPVVVAQSATSTAVTVTPSTLVSGQMAALTATISPSNPGGTLPTGNVEFFSGTSGTGVLLGTAAVTNGVGTLNTSALRTTDTSISATYEGDSNYLPSVASSSAAIQVTAAATTTALTITPNPSGLNQPVNLTAVVTVSTPGSGTPTGNVEFFNGPTLLGTQALPANSNTATFQISTLPLGATSITATYEGDTNFNTSTSAAQTATVLNATTSTASASLSSIVFGQSTTLMAVVAPAVGTSPTPTGNVQFLVNGSSIGNASLSNGTASLATTSLPVGALSVTVVYQGDTNYGGSTSPAITVTVAPANTTTAVTVVPNPSGLGQSVTLTATITPVSPGAGVPAGTVNFMNGSTSIGSATISGGVASLPTSALPLGASSITAMYTGGTDFNASTSPAVTANVEQASTTVLTAVPQTAVTGQSVLLTATVTATTGTTVPTGTVQFFSGTTSLGTGALNSSGVATLNTNALLAGTPSLTAVYSGDTTFAGSTSPAVSVTVSKASTTTAVSVVPNPSASGASVTLNATVTVTSPGNGTPTGTVQFFNGTTSLGTAALLSNGTANTTAAGTLLNMGANSITAEYLGDNNFNTSTSPAFTQNVLPATTTTVASSPSPSVVGQPVTLTAGVSSTAGVPTGTVQFFNGTTSLGTATLNGGVASIVTSALPFSFQSITATYQGSASFSPSTSVPITQTVQQASTSMSLTGSPNPASLGTTVTFTATVTPLPPSTGGPTPTGSVTFMDGTTTLGSGTLTNGVATFTTSTLSVGTHSITGIYVNDGNYSSSTSPAFNQVITLAAPTFNIGITTGNPVSNQAVVLTATITAVAPATAVPTGTVNFFADGSMIGSGTLTNGQTTLTFNSFALGNQTITATYSGDPNFAAQASTNSLPIKVGDGNQLYVNQLYLQMLGTIADPQGLTNFATLLANGRSRRYVVQQIASLSGLLKDSRLVAAILRTTHVSGNRLQIVTGIYQATVGRAPTSRELKSALARSRVPGGLNAGIINLLSSKEYFVVAFNKGSTGALASIASFGTGSLSVFQ